MLLNLYFHHHEEATKGGPVDLSALWEIYRRAEDDALLTLRLI